MGVHSVLETRPGAAVAPHPDGGRAEYTSRPARLHRQTPRHRHVRWVRVKVPLSVSPAVAEPPPPTSLTPQPPLLDSLGSGGGSGSRDPRSVHNPRHGADRLAYPRLCTTCA